MKVKIFNGFGEYEKDMEFEEFVKSGFVYSCKAEYDIFNSMKGMINTLKKTLNDEGIKSKLKEIYNTSAWNTYMYEDRFEYLMNEAFNFNKKILTRYMKAITESSNITSSIKWLDWNDDNRNKVFKEIIDEILEDNKLRYKINILVIAKEKKSKDNIDKFKGNYKIMPTEVEIYWDKEHSEIAFWSKNIANHTITKFASMEMALPKESHIAYLLASGYDNGDNPYYNNPELNICYNFLMQLDETSKFLQESKHE